MAGSLLLSYLTLILLLKLYFLIIIKRFPVRIVLFTACLFLLPSCAYLNEKLQTESIEENPSLMSCDVFPYDESDEPCNLIGWQEFASQVLSATEVQHRSTLLLLVGNTF